jgi:hypothetical protein
LGNVWDAFSTLAEAEKMPQPPRGCSRLSITHP